MAVAAVLVAVILVVAVAEDVCHKDGCQEPEVWEEESQEYNTSNSWKLDSERIQYSTVLKNMDIKALSRHNFR